ncbi:MAG: cupin domain-containing protein [Pseudoxanthomonas sp.]
MTKTLLVIALSISAPYAEAGEVASQQTIRAGTQPSRSGPAAYFTGRVRVEPFFQSDEDIQASAASVTFESSARSAWHTHPAGQRLLVTSGAGLTQEWGKPVQALYPGDVVVCPPGVKHWHGAMPDRAMTHLAVTGVRDGKTVDWMEKVDDDQYFSR